MRFFVGLVLVGKNYLWMESFYLWPFRCSMCLSFFHLAPFFIIRTILHSSCLSQMTVVVGGRHSVLTWQQRHSVEGFLVIPLEFSLLLFSRSVVPDSLWPHRHAGASLSFTISSLSESLCFWLSGCVCSLADCCLRCRFPERMPMQSLDGWFRVVPVAGCRLMDFDSASVFVLGGCFWFLGGLKYTGIS